MQQKQNNLIYIIIPLQSKTFDKQNAKFNINLLCQNKQ